MRLGIVEHLDEIGVAAAHVSSLSYRRGVENVHTVFETASLGIGAKKCLKLPAQGRQAQSVKFETSVSHEIWSVPLESCGETKGVVRNC